MQRIFSLRFVALVLLTALLPVGPTLAFDRGRVGTPPDYPGNMPRRDVRALLIDEFPTVTMIAPHKAVIRFSTTVASPAARVHFGIVEPDAPYPIPRYRSTAVETLDVSSVEHSIAVDLKGIMKHGLDLTHFAENNGGRVEYRIEAWDSEKAAATFYDGVFEYNGDRIVPAAVFGPFVDLVTPDSATISWDTDAPATARLICDGRTIDAGKKATHFEVVVSGLEPGRTHSYRMEIQDGEKYRAGRAYSFATPKRGASAFSFALMGDSRESPGNNIDPGCGEEGQSGVNRRTLSRLYAAAAERGADFLIHTGDLSSGYVTRPGELVMEQASYKRAAMLVGHRLPIYEIPGNHDVLLDLYDDGSRYGLGFDKAGADNAESLFARAFVNPANGPAAAAKGAPAYSETAYTFDYGNSRFVMINTNYWWSLEPEKRGGNLEGYILDDQWDWLKSVFSDAAKDPKVKRIFLFGHEPMFPNGGHASDAMWYSGGDPKDNDGVDRRYVVERRNQIWRSFIGTGKAAAAFFSDEHNYSRVLVGPGVDLSFTPPVNHIISGGAGAPYYGRDVNVPWKDAVAKFSTRPHFVMVNVNGDKVAVKVYDIEGGTIEEFGLTGK